MKIKSIHIKNVRGLGDRIIDLNMIPNKPSVLVAPNGSGKSSFAFAFQWLNRQRMKLNEDDAYMGDTNNKPSMQIETSDPNETLVADETKNEIARKFGIYVINSGLTAVTPGIKNGFAMGKARLSVPEVVLIDHIPQNPVLNDDFEAVYTIQNAPVGYYPVINTELSDIGFLLNLDTQGIRCTQRPLAKINAFIEKSKSYTGTRDARHSKIETDDYVDMMSIPAVAVAVEYFRRGYPADRNAKLLLRAIRLITLYSRNKDGVEARISYAQYRKQDQTCRELFATLRQTWNNISPHKEGTKVSLRIGDAQRVSNGERDIMFFIANLYKAKSVLTKENNILIIDEVFDYLDDANLMAAQFYITGFIKHLKEEGKNLFPIILSHLNPDYYNQHYSFKDLKVYYLCPLPHPNASDNMITLLRRRKELANIVGRGNEEEISKYMLHFHNDYSKDMTGLIGGCPVQWGNIAIFKSYCFNQIDNYLGNMTYDPLGVCVALREIIEERIFNQLLTAQQKENFLKQHGTPSKLDYAEELGVVVPELYYLLGNIYNDPMHVDNKSNKLITQTLYSRLENNTVRAMIDAVKQNRV